MKHCFGLFLCVAIVCGCAWPSEPFGQHQLVVIDGFGEPSSLNPYQDSYWATSVVTSELALAFLFRSSTTSDEFQPDLAMQVPTHENGGISADGLRIVYHLRPHLRWSDSTPLTSADVAFTVRVILNPKNNIVSDGFTDIASVETPDARTVVFHLKKPFADFLSTFFTTQGAYGVNPILPQHAFHGTMIATAAFNSLPIGSGPFRVVAWHRSSDIVFERNPYYWGTPAKLKSIRYLTSGSIESANLGFSTHEVQLWERIPEARIEAAMKAGRVILTSPDAYLHLDFNVRRPAVRDVAVRRAVLLALDRTALVRNASHGFGLTQEGVVSLAGPLAAHLPFQVRDLTQARRLLRGRHPSISLAYPSGDDMLSTMVEMIRSQLAQADITLETRTYDPVLFYNTILPKGNWDATIFNWTLDPSGNVESLFSCHDFQPTGQNDMRYCNPTLDNLFSRYDETYSFAERRSLLRREEGIIDTDLPTIVLFFRRFGYGLAQGVTGFHPRRDSPLDGFETVNVR